MTPICHNYDYGTAYRQAYWKTFLTSGMQHSKFVGTLTALAPEGARKVAEVASVLVPVKDSD
jgi:hypothetical protein